MEYIQKEGENPPFQDNKNNNEDELSQSSVKKDKKKEKIKENKKSPVEKIKSQIISFLQNKYNIFFLVVLITAIIVRLKYFNMESIWNDAAVHLWRAIEVTRNPLSLLFTQEYWLGDYAIPQTITAFFYVFTKNAFIAGKLMALTYSVLGLILIYMLGSELKNKFFGLMATLLLAFNHIFYFYSTRPLGDSPLTVSVIFMFYCLVKLEKEKKMFWGVLTGISFFINLFHKVQAVIFILGIAFYYIIFKRKEMFVNKPILMSWIIPWGSIFLGHIIAKILFNRSLLGRVFGLMGDFRGIPYGFEAAGMLKWIFSWYLIPFILLGIACIVFYKRKIYYGPLVLGFFYWIYFEINVDNTQDRYMLPLLSFGIILAVFGISELSHYISILVSKRIRIIFKKVIIFLIVLLIAFHYYGIADPLVEARSTSYAGHPEAGLWLKNNMNEEAILFAGSPRMMRTFVEKEYYNQGPDDSPLTGGPVRWLRGERYHENYQNWDYKDVVVNHNAQQNFKDDVGNLTIDHDLYVEIDIWEYTQPRWYFPITQDSINYFISLDFKLVKVVEREVNTQQGLQKMPVIFIFKKDQEKALTDQPPQSSGILSNSS